MVMLEQKLEKELVEVLNHKELMSLQKSMCDWFVEGDCNGKYEHPIVVIKGYKKKIWDREDSEGRWVTDGKDL